MKRIIIVGIALLCLGAGKKADLDKWTTTWGKWNREGGVLHTNNGIVVYPCEGKRGFMLSCKLFVHKWESTDEPKYLCVFWAFKGTSPKEPNFEDRQTLWIKASQIIFDGPPKQSFDVRIPLGKEIPVAIKSISGKTQITVGKTRFTTYARYSSPDKLALMIRNADAEIRNLRVKTK
ncbi:MAG: hypothetical protein GXP25_18470 [Planctomycetes bacterium]|nr:hypothetical protein [Planctomycetota bacterium]